MSLLLRYKKQGGFFQLLTLFETSSPQQRQRLLETISKENPAWHSLIKVKMLTLEKIFSWEETALRAILKDIPNRAFLAALSGVPHHLHERVLSMIEKEKQNSLATLKNSYTPTPHEMEVARIGLIHKVRELERNGELNLQTIDPTLSTHDLQSA